MGTFGLHLTIDGYEGDEKLMNNLELCRQVLDELPGKIDMQKMTAPYVIRDPDVRKPGVTGFVVIEFSHISLHTFVKDKYIAFDCFSCTPFDTNMVKDYIMKTFKLKHAKVNVIGRGTTPQSAVEVVQSRQKH